MKKGFTLMELLVVIAIIGILSSVVFVSLSNTKKKANVSSLIQQLKEMGKVMELEKSESSDYNKLLANVWLGLVATPGMVWTCESIYGVSNTSIHKDKALASCNRISHC